MANVRVNLGPASYDIVIKPGVLRAAGEWMARQPVTRKALVVSDGNVGGLYGEQVLTSLRQAGFSAELIMVKAGEDSKSLATAMEVYTAAITLGLDRKSPIIALGGGVVGDLSGFVAATYLRGVPFIQLPTTLLAQVDSSVGGKVAINHPLGKNLVGSFYQPQLVLIDTQALRTLPDRELRAGLAEVIKYGIIGDTRLFAFLNENHASILAQQEEALTEIIHASCRDKAEIVGQDERETGIRVILNFGHTIAHAIEASTGFERYNHGEAVAIGMHGAALISRRMGLCPQSMVDRIREMLLVYGLPATAAGCDTSTLLTYLHRDKKTVGGRVNWVLVEDAGKVAVRGDVPETIVTAVLDELT